MLNLGVLAASPENCVLAICDADFTAGRKALRGELKNQLDTHVEGLHRAMQMEHMQTKVESIESKLNTQGEEVRAMVSSLEDKLDAVLEKLR